MRVVTLIIVIVIISQTMLMAVEFIKLGVSEAGHDGYSLIEQIELEEELIISIGGGLILGFRASRAVRKQFCLSSHSMLPYPPPPKDT